MNPQKNIPSEHSFTPSSSNTSIIRKQIILFYGLYGPLHHQHSQIFFLPVFPTQQLGLLFECILIFLWIVLYVATCLSENADALAADNLGRGDPGHSAGLGGCLGKGALWNAFQCHRRCLRAHANVGVTFQGGLHTALLRLYNITVPSNCLGCFCSQAKPDSRGN